MSDEMITSTRNARVRAAVALARRRERVSSGLFLLEGPNAVEGALDDDVLVEVFVTEDVAPDWEDRLPPGVELHVVADHVLERVADSRSPQGLVAVGRVRRQPLEDLVGSGLLVALHEVSDPGNAGTVVRLADALGARGVVLGPGSVDPENPKAVRAAAGSLTHVPLATDVDSDTLLAACRAVGQPVVALDAHGDTDVDDVPVGPAGVVVLGGSEAHGLPREVVERVDVVARLPMWGRAESLNLGTALAVAAYSLARRVRR